MDLKVLAAAAAMAILAAGAAHAQPDAGRPPYSGDAFDGEACGGFTIVGGHAGVTVLGFNFGAGTGARFGGDCAGYRPIKTPAQPAWPPYGAGPTPAFGAPGGAPGMNPYYNPAAFGPGPYAAPMAYAPVAPVAYAPPLPAYGYGAPCGCQPQAPLGYQPY